MQRDCVYSTEGPAVEWPVCELVVSPSLPAARGPFAVQIVRRGAWPAAEQVLLLVQRAGNVVADVNLADAGRVAELLNWIHGQGISKGAESRAKPSAK